MTIQLTMEKKRCPSWLAENYETASFITLWHRRKTNHANQSSHSREPIPPLGSVSKHSTVATVIWIVNTVNELNCTDIHLFRSLTQSLIHVSEYLQPSIELQCEQTAAQIRHNNLPMPFMWLTEPAQSIHTAHQSQTNTHTHIHTPKCLRCQSK